MVKLTSYKDYGAVSSMTVHDFIDSSIYETGIVTVRYASVTVGCVDAKACAKLQPL